MTDINLVGVTWGNFPGGPGRSTFAFTSGGLALIALKDLFGLLGNIIPSGITINTDTTGPVVNDADGELVSTWTANPTTQVTCAGSGDYASGVGGVIRWNTPDVAHGHSVRGHTFLVPLIASVFDTNGSLDDGNRALIDGAAQATINSYVNRMLVWHRPKRDPVTHEVTRAGSSHVITTGFGVDRPAVLRSRRN